MADPEHCGGILSKKTWKIRLGINLGISRNARNSRISAFFQLFEAEKAEEDVASEEDVVSEEEW